MDEQKIRALADSGRFDLSCECTTKNERKVYTEDKLSQAALDGVYMAHIKDGRTVPIFKTLMSDSCTHDCNYCSNSTNCTKKKNKHSYTPQELARVFMHLHTKHEVQGLFLSSGIIKDADYTTDMMLDAVKIIRHKYQFRGYIHFKALPGVSYDKLKEARLYATRMSINIEATSTQRINELSSVKDYKIDLLKRQAWIKKLSPSSGQSTQLVVGAAGESDWEVLKMMRWEYENMDLHRMYYSAFSPLDKTPLEKNAPAPKWRSHRLYNVDWLFRKYKYDFRELKELINDDDMLPNQDPKITHAQKFLERPVDISDASYKELIRVPGIGMKTARNIIRERKHARRFKRDNLHRCGVILKRADPFIKVEGHTQKTLCSF